MNGPFSTPIKSPLEEPCLGIFNGAYRILKLIGEGHTSKVYKARSLKDGKMAALKLLREDYLQKEEDAITAVENEI
jgi:serine/threonine protein kinase